MGQAQGCQEEVWRQAVQRARRRPALHPGCRRQPRRVAERWQVAAHDQRARAAARRAAMRRVCDYRAFEQRGGGRRTGPLAGGVISHHVDARFGSQARVTEREPNPPRTSPFAALAVLSALLSLLEPHAARPPLHTRSAPPLAAALLIKSSVQETDRLSVCAGTGGRRIPSPTARPRRSILTSADSARAWQFSALRPFGTRFWFWHGFGGGLSRFIHTSHKRPGLMSLFHCENGA